jgi:hypothetical protein
MILSDSTEIKQTEQDIKLLKQSTNSIELSLSWQANSRSAGKEIPRCSQNPKVHISPPLVPILSQMNPVLTFIPIFFKIRFNIILSFPEMEPG